MSTDLLDRLAEINPHRSAPDPTEDTLDKIVQQATHN